MSVFKLLFDYVMKTDLYTVYITEMADKELKCHLLNFFLTNDKLFKLMQISLVLLESIEFRMSTESNHFYRVLNNYGILYRIS